MYIKRINYINKKSGRLRVIEDLGSKIFGITSKRKRKILKCICSCGNIVIVYAENISKKNHTTSCGCLIKEKLKKGLRYSHGLSHSRFCKIWRGIKQRCNNKNNISYVRYGNIGIRCLWKSFKNFKNDMYESYIKHCIEYGEKNTQIDRINGLNHYYKENCRWVTIKEQNNNRNCVKIIEYNGKRLNINEWEKYLNFKSGTLHNRIFKYRWNVNTAFNIPVYGKK